MMDDKLVRLSDVERWILTEAACIDTPADRDAVVDRMQYSIPAVDAVPMDFHDRCMQIEIRKRMEVERSRPEVVRCRECRYFCKGENESERWEWCDCWKKDCWEDCYCACGQRREDGV